MILIWMGCIAIAALMWVGYENGWTLGISIAIDLNLGAVVVNHALLICSSMPSLATSEPVTARGSAGTFTTSRM